MKANKFGILVLLLIGSLLISCSTQVTGQDSEQFLYKSGDRVCYNLPAYQILVTLAEDVKFNQVTVRAEKDDGSFIMVDLDYVIDPYYCK